MSTEDDLSPQDANRLLDTLAQVMRLLRRNFDASAAEVGLTFSRARALSTLAKSEGATQAELALSLGIEVPTLKRQVDALVADGFVERRGLENDARKRALFLTEKAQASRFTQKVDAARTEIVRGISPAEARIVQATLQRIAENAARMGRE